MGEEMRILSIRPRGTSKIYFTCRKILRHGTFALYFPSERKVCCGFLSPLKNPSPWSGSNPQTLGPVGRTLITTPPRRLLATGPKGRGFKTSQVDGFLRAIICSTYSFGWEVNPDTPCLKFFYGMLQIR
jgi:hypothetical protein